MDGKISIDEWVADYAPKGTHQAFLYDGGSPFQILSIKPDGETYLVETCRGRFRRKPSELVGIARKEQRTSVIRKR